MCRLQHFRFLIILAFLVSSITCYDIGMKWIKSYFLHKLIHQVVVFSCGSDEERVEYFLNLSASNIRMSYVSLESHQMSLKNILAVNYYKLGIYLNLDCGRSDAIFQQLLKDNIPFNESYFWLITTNEIEFPISRLRNLPLSINAEVVAASRQNDTYSLYDVYNPSYRHGGKLNVTFMGHWNTADGLRVSLTMYKYKRRGNLHGLPLNFSVVANYLPKNMDLVAYLSSRTDLHLDTQHRYCFAFVQQLQNFYNYTMNLSRGTTWGYIVNGSFNGILGDMVKGIVDISVTGFRSKLERVDVMEMTVAGYVEKAVLILRHPKTNSLTNNFLKPFDERVWWATFFVALITGILLYSSFKMESQFEVETSSSSISITSEAGLIVTTAICQQGSTVSPGINSGRIIFISLFVWAFFLYQFYTSSIVGSLLAAPERFINTVYDVADSDIEVAFEDVAYHYDLLQTSKDPAVRYLYDKKLAVNRKRKKVPFLSAEEGLRKVQKGGFAFHIAVATAYKIIEETFSEDEICDLIEIELVPRTEIYIGTSKHSPFQKMVTYGLRHVVERGMAERLRHYWLHRRPKCPASHSSKPIPIQITEFFPAIALLLMGCSLAVFIIITEHVYQRLQRQKLVVLTE